MRSSHSSICRGWVCSPTLSRSSFRLALARFHFCVRVGTYGLRQPGSYGLRRDQCGAGARVVGGYPRPVRTGSGLGGWASGRASPTPLALARCHADGRHSEEGPRLRGLGCRTVCRAVCRVSRLRLPHPSLVRLCWRSSGCPRFYGCLRCFGCRSSGRREPAVEVAALAALVLNESRRSHWARSARRLLELCCRPGRRCLGCPRFLLWMPLVAVVSRARGRDGRSRCFPPGRVAVRALGSVFSCCSAAQLQALLWMALLWMSPCSRRRSRRPFSRGGRAATWRMSVAGS